MSPRPPHSEEIREERRQQLIEAARRLWEKDATRIPSVLEVAQEAGVGKGTVYLYFKTKEDLLLAVHEHGVAEFFQALTARAEQDQPMSIEDMLSLMRTHLQEHPTFLPMAMFASGVIDKHVSPEVVQAFDQRMTERLYKAGMLLSRHFPLPAPEAGAQLLMRSYALKLGLWQLLSSRACANLYGKQLKENQPEYLTELEGAMRVLWRGTFAVGGE